jgi:hypothetical protein
MSSNEIGPSPKIFRTPAVRRVSRDEQGGNKEGFKKELQEQTGEQDPENPEQPEHEPEPLLEDDDEHEPGDAAPGVGVNLDIST